MVALAFPVSTTDPIKLDTDGQNIEVGRIHYAIPPATIVPGTTYEAPPLNAGDPVQYALQAILPTPTDGDFFQIGVLENTNNLPVHLDGNFRNDPDGVTVFPENGPVWIVGFAGTYWPVSADGTTILGGGGGTGDVTQVQLANANDNILINGGTF